MTTRAHVEWLEKDALPQEVARRIERTSVALDIGPGLRPQRFFRPDVHLLAEPFSDYVEVLRGYYADTPSRVVLLQGTALEVLRLLPDRSVDSVFMIDVIEHLPREAGESALAECLRVARRQVAIFTPLGFVEQTYHPGEDDAWGLGGGQWQTHLSGWHPDDFDSTWRVLACRDFHDRDAKGNPLDPPAGAFWAIKTMPPPATPPLTFLLVSDSFPPSNSDQAVLLGRLLADLPPEAYAIASAEDHRETVPSAARPPRLAGRHHQLPALPPPVDVTRFASPRRLTRGLRIVATRAEAIRRVVVEAGLQAIVGCSGDLYDLPAAWLAGRMAGVPFFAYYFNLYSHPFVLEQDQGLMGRLGATLLRHCAGVLASNEHLARALATRHGIDPSVVHGPAASGTEVPDTRPYPKRPGRLAIFYAGAVTGPHEAPLRRLVAAVASLDRAGVELRLHTSTPPRTLEERGLLAPFVSVFDELPLQRVAAALRSSDLIFLALPFDSARSDVVETTAPAGLGDYLASGLPLLTHAPAGTFAAWYVAHHECGVVVDVPAPEALASTISRLSDDSEWRTRLVTNALARARHDFSPEQCRAQLFGALVKGRDRVTSWAGSGSAP